MTHAILADIQNTLDEAAATYSLQIRKLTNLDQESESLDQAKLMQKRFKKASGDIDFLLPETKLTETNTKQLEDDVAKLRQEILAHSRKRRYSVRDIPESVKPTDSYSFTVVDSFEAIEKPLPSKIYLTQKKGLWWYIVTPRPSPKPVLTPTPLSAAKNLSRHSVVSALFKMRADQKTLSPELALQIQNELRPGENTYRAVISNHMPAKKAADTIYIWHDNENHLGAWQYLITENSKEPQITTPRQLREISTIRDGDIPKLAHTTTPSLAFAVHKRELIEAIVPGNNTYMTLRHLQRTALKARKIARKDATAALLAPIATEFLKDLSKFTEDQPQLDRFLAALYNYVKVIEKSHSTGKVGEAASLACDVLLHALREMPKEKLVSLHQKLQPLFARLNEDEEALTKRITHYTDNSLKQKRFFLRTKNWVHLEHFKIMHFGMSKNLKDLSTSLDAVYREVSPDSMPDQLANSERKDTSNEKLAFQYEHFIESTVQHQFDDLLTTHKQELKLNAAVKKLLSDLSASAGNWFSCLLNPSNKPGLTWTFNPNRIVRSLQNCHRLFLETFPNKDASQIDQLFKEILNTHLVEMHLDHPNRFNRLQHILHSEEYYNIEKTAKSCSESITDRRQAPINDLSRIFDMVRTGSENIPGAEEMTKPKRRTYIQASYVTAIKENAQTAMELAHYRTLRR